MKPLSAASEIDAWCTKCRLTLGHRIVALVAGVPKRVVCLTCNSEHNYRPPRATGATAGVHVRSDRAKGAAAGNSSPGTSATRVAQKARAEHERYETWASRTLGQAVDAFTKYSMERTFRPGELVMHPKFGEGYVEQVLEGGKVDVVFRDGHKILAHRP
ncbi:MAG TPA: hypothetical protein VIM73_05695 [Polyangiaceae bacterium]